MAIALKINTMPIAINKSFGFALIRGAIAAIAVAPHIAVPEAINNPKLLSTLISFARRIPTKKTVITKTEI